jgi:regulator of nucleoside diphosphate kinase
MKYGRIIIEKKEYELIKKLIHHIEPSQNLFNKCIQKLKNELQNAAIKDENEMPEDVVRLDSKVDVLTHHGLLKLQLVLPERSNTQTKRISILTPMGSALLGYALGDKVVWEFPDGEKEITIHNIQK